MFTIAESDLNNIINNIKNSGLSDVNEIKNYYYKLFNNYYRSHGLGGGFQNIDEISREQIWDQIKHKINLLKNG